MTGRGTFKLGTAGKVTTNKKGTPRNEQMANSHCVGLVPSNTGMVFTRCISGIKKQKTLTTTKGNMKAEPMLEINYNKFDWFDVLVPLAQGAPIHFEDQKQLTDKAGSWPTCACGQLCTKLGRNRDKSPIDQQLNLLGVQFAGFVQDQKWELALRCFNKIEERVANILGIPLIERVVPHQPVKHAPMACHRKPFAVEMSQS